jgi:hypothetical protein
LKHSDANGLPERNRANEIRFKNRQKTTGDVEVIFDLRKNVPVHLEVPHKPT